MATANYCKFVKLVIDSLDTAGGSEAVANRCEDVLISHTAINFILDNETRRSEFIEDNLDLSFATDFWRRCIVKTTKAKTTLNGKELEIYTFEFAVKGLNSGDLKFHVIN